MTPRLEWWLRSVYGKAGDGDRSDWARRAVVAILAGEPFVEPMPRDRYKVGADRLEGIRRAVAELA